MTAIAAMLALTATLPTSPAHAALPKDPGQRVAAKALAGRYGHLSDWHRTGYRAILHHGKPARLVLTGYYGTEGSGRTDAHGNRCTLHTAASNKLPQGTWLWTEASGLRRVSDTGSHSNDRRAARKGGTWVDIWWPRPSAARVDGWTAVRGTVAR